MSDERSSAILCTCHEPFRETPPAETQQPFCGLLPGLKRRSKDSLGLAFDAQKAAAEAYVKEHGGEIIGEYEEIETGKDCQRKEILKSHHAREPLVCNAPHRKTRPTCQKCLVHEYADGIRHRLRRLRQPAGVEADDPYPRGRRPRRRPGWFPNARETPLRPTRPVAGFLARLRFGTKRRGRKNRRRPDSEQQRERNVEVAFAAYDESPAHRAATFAGRGLSFQRIANTPQRAGIPYSADRKRMEQDPSQAAVWIGCREEQGRKAIPTPFLLSFLNCDRQRRIGSHLASSAKTRKRKARRGDFLEDSAEKQLAENNAKGLMHAEKYISPGGHLTFLAGHCRNSGHS